MTNAAGHNEDYPLEEAIAVLPNTIAGDTAAVLRGLSCQEAATRLDMPLAPSPKRCRELTSCFGRNSKAVNTGTNRQPNGTAMNCAECRTIWPPSRRGCWTARRAAMQGTPGRLRGLPAEYEAVAGLQRRLIARGRPPPGGRCRDGHAARSSGAIQTGKRNNHEQIIETSLGFGWRGGHPVNSFVDHSKAQARRSKS